MVTSILRPLRSVKIRMSEYGSRYVEQPFSRHSSPSEKIGLLSSLLTRKVNFSFNQGIHRSTASSMVKVPSANAKVTGGTL